MSIKRLSGILKVSLVALLASCTSDDAAPPPSSAPPIVVPAALEDFEPQVKSYVSKYLANARAFPGDAERRARLGLVLLANKLALEAYGEFSVAVDLDPEQKLAQYYMGIVKRDLGDTESALKLFGDVIRKFPDFAPAHHSFGEQLLSEGRTEEARLAFQRAVDLAPSEPNGYVGLAHTAIVARDFKRAEELLDKALGYRLDHPRARYLRGLAYRGLGRRKEAARELKAGHARQKYSMPDPWTNDLFKHDKSAHGVITLSKSHTEAGRHEEAMASMESALAANPDDVDLLLATAAVYINLERPVDALAYASRALKVDSTSSEVCIKMALCHRALGNLDATLKFARRAAELAPESSTAHHFCADMLRIAKKPAESLASLREASRLDPGNSTILTETGAILMQLARTAEGKAELETAIDIDPDNVLAYLNLASACIHLKQWNDARSLLVEARKRAPRDSRIEGLMAQLPAE
jgi:tetratricopeptide (TPR) repeat protein